MNLSIKEIVVEKLFGYYNYTIVPDSNESISEKLLVFYGDNGSGKTTILRLIFALLSTKLQSGFKSEISRTKFHKFSIRFTNNIEIGAERRGPKIMGSFNFYIKKDNRKIFQSFLKAEDDLSINVTTDEKVEKKFKEILESIKKLGIRVFYLSDQRKLFNSITSTINDDHEELDTYNRKVIERNLFKKRAADFSKYSVDAALDKLKFWVSEQVIVNSKIGERNTNNIYIEIANSIIRTRKNSKDGNQRANEISKLIEEMSIRSSEFANLGLINSFETKEISDALRKAKSEKLYTITAVLEPFVEGIKARLNALEILKNTIQKFIFHVNNYFSKKYISFNLTDGFSIKYEGTNEPIRLNSLSSGERQLVLLFANTITATDQATFFIIDEPEISLNIKWQRMLINSLLDLSLNANVQFLLATHSFELLSAQPECVVKLTEK